MLAKRPDGPIGSENFDYVEVEMPEPNDDEVLIRNLYVSFDPTQRNMMIDQPGYLPPVELGAPMRAATGQVVSSRNAEFAEGELASNRLLAGFCCYFTEKQRDGCDKIARWCASRDDVVSPWDHWADSLLWHA